MSNTAISASVMRGVLEQLPQMSGKIVDDTRHEKVLSYMRLFLASDAAVEQLLSWDVLGVLNRCLQPQSDFRVSAAAVRFLGDALNAPNGRLLWTALDQTPEIISWIVSSADSPNALVRLACLYFARQASQINDAAFVVLLERLDYPRLLTRRLLDCSYFVAAEACALLGRLFCINGRADPQLVELVERLVSRPFDAQTTARKSAVLAAVETLHGEQGEARVFAMRVFALGLLEPYLFDVDRMVRDKALDVLELMLLVIGEHETGQLVATLDRRLGADRRVVCAAVVLRCLAAMVKQMPRNSMLGRNSALQRCQQISSMAVSLLQHIHPATDVQTVEPHTDIGVELISIETHITELLSTTRQPGPAATTVACEAARIIREHSRTTFSHQTIAVMYGLLSNARVQQHAQLLQLVLDAIVQTLRLARHQSYEHLQMLPQLVSTFAIRAPGLRGLFDLALEALDDADVRFVRALEHAVRSRVADVEWEARDTVLEFIARAVRAQQPLIGDLVTHAVVDDVVRALSDAEEYVRASAAQTLAAIVECTDTEQAHFVVAHAGLASDALARLVGDGEAFVKRAALDLLCALGTRAIADSIGSTDWVDCLSYHKLYLIADDPDFEVRVRCARLLSLLTRNERLLGVQELQSGALLLDMCRDSSRYVRKVCLDSLQALKRELEEGGSVGLEPLYIGEPESKRVEMEDKQSLFYDKLCQVDFGRLEASLSAEHLYQEALDTQVERELMKEQSDANAGNNILDCY